MADIIWWITRTITRTIVHFYEHVILVFSAR